MTPPVTVVFVNDSGPALAVRPQPRRIAGSHAEDATPELVPQAEQRPAEAEAPMMMGEDDVAPAPVRPRRARRRAPARRTLRSAAVRRATSNRRPKRRRTARRPS